MTENPQLKKNLFHGTALSLFLIGFGLFLTFGTFGFLAIVGIPLVVYGFYVGVMEIALGDRGRNWYGRRGDRPAVE